MVFLWIFGCHAEDAIGIPKYLVLYVCAGLTGCYLQGMTDVLFLHSLRGGIGASGAIMGLLGLYAIRYRHVNVNVFYWYYWYTGTFQVRALYVGLFYVGMDLLTGSETALAGMAGTIGNFAHVGGFVCGVACAVLLRLPAAALVDETRTAAADMAAAGAYGAAASEMERAIARDPSNPELRREAARYLSQKPQMALQACGQWSCALRLWLRREEHEAALEHWSEARKRFKPEEFDPEVALHMAVLAEAEGLTQEAAETYRGVVVGHPQHRDAPRAALKLADLLLRENQPARARQWCEYLVSNWPDCEEALSAQEHLQRLRA